MFWESIFFSELIKKLSEPISPTVFCVRYLQNVCKHDCLISILQQHVALYDSWLRTYFKRDFINLNGIFFNISKHQHLQILPIHRWFKSIFSHSFIQTCLPPYFQPLFSSSLSLILFSNYTNFTLLQNFYITTKFIFIA